MAPDEMDRWLTVHDKCIRDLEKGLEQHGQYTYYDKGSVEIFDVDSFRKALILLGPAGASWVLKKVNLHEHGKKLVQDMLVHLDDWDEFDNMDEELVGGH